MALKESQWAQKAAKSKPKALTPEQQAQEQARAGNAQAVKNPNTISSVPKPVSPLTPEQQAQEQARASTVSHSNFIQGLQMIEDAANKAQEQARAGNTQAVKNPNTISSVPKSVSFPAPEQQAQMQARAGNAAKVNGGKQVGNTNQDVANAKPGDFIQRSNGTIYVLKAGDITWAKKKVGSKDMPKNTPPKKPMSGKPNVVPAETGPIGKLKNPKTNTAIDYEIEQAKKQTPYSQMTTRDFKKAVQSGAIRVPRNIIDIVNKGV